MPENYSSALDRGLRILDAVASVTRIRVEDIAAAVNLPVSTVYRYVRQLRDAGYLYEVDGFCSVSARFAGDESRRDTQQLVALAEPVLLHLRDTTAQTALLSIRVAATVLCLERVAPRRPARLTFTPGSVQPLYVGCSAQVLLAHAPARVVEEVLSGPIHRPTAQTLHSDELRERLRAVRTRGYAISRGEGNVDAVGVAAPVFRGHTCVCTVSVAGPASTLVGANLKNALDLVINASRALGGILERTEIDIGWSPPDHQ